MAVASPASGIRTEYMYRSASLPGTDCDNNVHLYRYICTCTVPGRYNRKFTFTYIRRCLLTSCILHVQCAIAIAIEIVETCRARCAAPRVRRHRIVGARVPACSAVDSERMRHIRLEFKPGLLHLLARRQHPAATKRRVELPAARGAEPGTVGKASQEGGGAGENPPESGDDLPGISRVASSP